MEKKLLWGMLILGLITAILQTGLCLYAGKDWTWPFIAGLWVMNSMILQRIVDRVEKTFLEEKK